MAKIIYLDRLLRLTLTRKGKAVAKHPYQREGAVEAIKATPVTQNETDSPLWSAVKAADDIPNNDAVPGLARYASGRYQ
jgi:hypothetical protein